MICVACGKEVAPGSKFCGNCGNPVAVSEPKICAGCGHELAAGAKFCGACGRPVQGAAVQSPANSQPSVSINIDADKLAADAKRFARKTADTVQQVAQKTASSAQQFVKNASANVQQGEAGGSTPVAGGSVKLGSLGTFSPFELGQVAAAVVMLVAFFMPWFSIMPEYSGLASLASAFASDSLGALGSLNDLSLLNMIGFGVQEYGLACFIVVPVVLGPAVLSALFTALRVRPLAFVGAALALVVAVIAAVLFFSQRPEMYNVGIGLWLYLIAGVAGIVCAIMAKGSMR